MKRTALSNSWRRFRADRSGAVAIIVGLSIIALVGTAGLGIDFYNALAAKSRLDLASDAAAIAAINTAQSYITANSATQVDPALTNGAIAAGEAQAQKVFKSNAGSTANIASTPTVTMTRSGRTINASISYQAASQAAFGPLFGVTKINMNGASSSSLTMGKYLDFYLLLDVSGSMGLPATAAGQTQLASISPDMKNAGAYPSGCAFACHFSTPQCTTIASPTTNVMCQGYSLAQSNGIVIRAAAVGSAVQSLLTTAVATETITNQYRVGLYPFINNMGTLYAISSNLTNANTCAGYLGAFLDQGQSPPTPPSGFSSLCSLPWSPDPKGTNDNGGTQFENVIPELDALIPAGGVTIGTGSAASSPQPFVFLVTDGTEDDQYYNSGWGPTQTLSLLNTSLCTTVKNRGITVAVLYIPYQPIANPNPSFSGNEDGIVNGLIPNIPSTLQQCASSGFYFTAYTPQDITNAMQAMFAQSLAAARLTQ